VDHTRTPGPANRQIGAGVLVETLCGISVRLTRGPWRVPGGAADGACTAAATDRTRFFDFRTRGGLRKNPAGAVRGGADRRDRWRVFGRTGRGGT